MIETALLADASGGTAERRSLAAACAPISTRTLPTTRESWPLAAGLLDSSRECCARIGCSMEDLWLSAWSLLVCRLTGETQIAVAETGAARRAIHFIDIRERTVTEFVRSVHQLRAINRQAVPLGPVQDVEAEGCWNFDGDDAAPEAVVGWAFSASSPTVLRAASDAVEASLLQRMGKLLLRLIEQLTAARDRPLQEIALLEPSESARMLIEWNDTSRPAAPAQTVHALFSLRARQAPDRIALELGTRRLTYAALEQRSTAWAEALRAAQVERGSIVAVMLPRSLEAIVALLAILKAGGVYMPLDEAYPADRLRFMLKDSDATIVLTDRTHAAHHAAPGVRVIHIEDLPTDVASPDVPPRAQDDTDLAYIMYTSGSTGIPKGVEIPHAAILRLVCHADYTTLGPDSAFLHAAPLGFDASTLEIWGPLLNGGRCILHDEVIPTGPGLAASIARHGVTNAWLTAALFNAVVDDDPRHLGGLRELLIGGEALSVTHVVRAYRALPGIQIINGYGPTECTTFAATHAIARELPIDAHCVPIGRPISQTTLYVLNRALQPVPAGFIGELFIGGAGLARGYRKRPELTAQRFVMSAVADTAARLYRTGDLVRFTDQDTIEFAGRADGQVKIRGYRIETGEIEAALCQQVGVRSCAVIAREDRPGDKRLVAYVVLAEQATSIDSLRRHLAHRLPEFMLPSAYVLLERLPITANGKLDRRALPAPTLQRPALAEEFRGPANETERRICAIFATTLGIEPIGSRDNFFDLGGNSLLALRAIAALREAFSTALPATTFFQHPTAQALAAQVVSDALTQQPHTATVRARRLTAGAAAAEPVAIIGMAGRFPGAASVEQFWDNLCSGRESITFFSEAQLDPAVPSTLRADANYVKARGVLDDADLFDAAFFGVSPKEAELMDPQQRKFLEICWECLEHAGYAPDSCPGPVGVFAGMYNASYFQRHLVHHPDLIEKVGEFQVMLANEKDYIATRTAHRLNLTGPAISVHTACSTSLVAVCQAFDALRNGQCDMALAGGASINCPPNSGYLYQEGAMLSPDGHTRSFAADAQGTVFSDGAAVVLLKRLSDAIADGDSIFAVIRGAGVNNDGSQKASFTAPSAAAQADVIALAHQVADVDARSITYVETHGTATPLGDPIEIEGLTRAFRRHTQERGFCAIGSVKSNVGHMVIAAGAGGLIKTALALKNGLIPPSINHGAPNPKIDFADSPFYVNTELSEWQVSGGPRRAGVSSFGVGGTNAHLVVDEPPTAPAAAASAPPYLLLLSARDEAALASAATRLAAHLTAHPGDDLGDVAYTLRVGRKHFQHRGFAVVSSSADAINALSSEAGRFTKRPGRQRVPEVVFMFPGQGAQYPGMGSTLYRSDAGFRAAFDACSDLLLPHAGFDLREKLFSAAPDTPPDTLVATAVTQPATFAVEYCLAQHWLARGVRPAALIGHSVGEFVAAVLAGVLTLPDALRLIACRGRLMQAQPSGSMLSIRLPAEQVVPRMPSGLSLAANNSPQATVVAGPAPLIEEFRATLEREGVANRVLQTSHAFHSAMMQPVVAPFAAEVRQAVLSAPTIPIASTLTGAWLQADEATDVHYWSRHLREPVLFSPAFKLLCADPARVLLEIGPRNTLTTLGRQHFTPKQPKPELVATLADSIESEQASLANAVGTLWAGGLEFDTTPLLREQGRRRIPLPTYPFERKRHWVPAGAAPQAPVAVAMPAQQYAPALPVPLPTLPASAAMAAVPAIPAPENPMSVEIATPTGATSRRDHFIERLRLIVDEVVGVDLEGADPAALFVELGLDSLALTQVALQLQKAFGVKITFRQLMETYSSPASLAEHLDTLVPREATPAAPAAAPTAPAVAAPGVGQPVPFAPMLNRVALPSGASPMIQQVIEQQMQLMAQQLALLSSIPAQAQSTAAASPVAALQAAASRSVSPAPAPQSAVVASAAALGQAAPQPPTADDDAAAGAMMKYDVKKAFGAIARIHTKSTTELTERQKMRLETFMRRYIARTQKSKDYTVRYRPRLADPRVVNGFRPQLKEIIYQIVVDRSHGAHVWDLDGNQYVDALNGFGMSLFGWQPPFVLEAVRAQLEAGYEIGPQHVLAGEVAELICETTGFDRAGLCNTGSEAVMGALRIARTVTGRSKIALFSGAYHGIFDEVIVRGAKKLRAVPAAPGIMPNTAENVLVLDYGTPESLEIIKTHASELAAVLIEPVQSRRPDLQPREFLEQLREITRESGTLFIFDEVVTGFRAHPRGAQAVLGVEADLATYGKVVGGGFPIGVIAGKREYMDALDGGGWQYGDESIPTVGVTYFAGTFVRHPLALAAAKAVLVHLKERGPALQEALNARTAALAAELNAFCEEAGAPIAIKHFSSVWKTNFTEDHPLQDLLFAMMRSRGIHILDNFPCFFTTAHTEADFAAIANAFKESVRELQEADFLPRRAATARVLLDASKPPVPGARLGRDTDGKPAWFIPSPDNPGRFLKVNG
jgi:amino acid adenylation domain-containing protein